MKHFTAILTAALIILFAASAGAAITKGPYLQSPSTESMVIALETDEDLEATVEVGLDTNYGLEFVGDGNHFVFDTYERYSYAITIDGLEADTSYHYRVTVGGETTEDFIFSTAPDELVPFRFVVMGDTRGGSTSAPNLEHEALVDKVIDEGVDFYINTGDMVSSGIDLDAWDYFFDAERDLISQTALLPVIGNHEMDQEWGVTGLGMFSRVFETPNHGFFETFYSFDYVNVRFIVLDLENWYTFVLPGVLQHDWFEQRLQEFQDDPSLNFCFVAFHQPPFSYKDGRMGHIVAQLYVQPLMKKYGAVAAFEGHDHFYARHRMNGIDHIVAGGGGAPLYDFQTFPAPPTLPGYQMHDRSNHYIVVDVTPTETALTVIRLDGTVIETFSYTADPPQWPVDDDDDDDTTPVDDDDDTTPVDDDDDDTTPGDDDDDDATPTDDDDDDDDNNDDDNDDDNDDSGGCGG
ncbi:MAG: metallophosphoesterase family protein [Candidatus Lernaella stagnicola]|nr:metallophosphoesterase family protein [Candidatus Lernaella stagnicola]